MKIYSFNVNGLRAIAKKGFFEWVIKEQPDILLIQETKLQEDQLTDDLKNIEGYVSYFSSAEKKGYSGTGAYIKKELSEKVINISHGVSIPKFDNEGRFLIIEFPFMKIYNIYFPNGQMNDDRLAYKLEFYDECLKLWNREVAMGKDILVSGDYNTAHKDIDLKNPKSNAKRSGFLPIERAWIDSFIEHGFVDTFRAMNPEKIEYSWWSYRFNARKNNAGWRIDYHFVNERLYPKVKDAAILTEITGSDHCPVMVEIEEK